MLLILASEANGAQYCPRELKISCHHFSSVCIYCYTDATTYIAHMLYLVSILVRDLSDNFYLHLRAVESTSLVKPIDSIKTIVVHMVRKKEGAF